MGANLEKKLHSVASAPCLAVAVIYSCKLFIPRYAPSVKSLFKITSVNYKRMHWLQ